MLRLLQRLPYEVVTKRGGPVRKAVRKGALVIRNEARAQFTARTQTPGKTGVNYGTGFTAKHIILKRRPPYQGKGERFIVTVRPAEHFNNHKIGKGKKPLRANDAAFLMEYGSTHQPAEPWLRPTFETKRQQAADTMVATLRTELDRIVARLGAG